MEIIKEINPDDNDNYEWVGEPYPTNPHGPRTFKCADLYINKLNGDKYIFVIYCLPDKFYQNGWYRWKNGKSLIPENRVKFGGK